VLGLVDQVVPDALGTALTLAHRISGRPAGSIAAIKRLCRHVAPETGIEQDIEKEQREIRPLWIGDEAMRLMTAFCAGRFDIREGEIAAGPLDLSLDGSARP
jgi:enoyl-CoA hydratase/carnithine racemase